MKKQKRVLLLNASHNDERLLAALKKLGCYVITTGNRPELPGHSAADEYVYGDYTNQEEMLALAKEKKVDAVCPCCNDFGVKTAAYVSEKMGFNGQDSYETTLILHDKDKFKKFAQELGGIETPFAAAFEDCTEAIAWAQTSNLTFPLIVKPVDLSAGNGIQRVDNLEELLSAISLAFEKSRVKHIVVEPFIQGTQHGFCTYLIGQKVVAICSNNEYSIINPYRVEIDTYPAIGVESVTLELTRQIEAMAHALHLTDGIFHLQYIMHEGKATILECMRRVLGNLYSIPAEGLGNGFDWDYWEVRAKCGFGCENFPKNLSQTGFWAYRALIAPTNGIYDSYWLPESMRQYIYSEYILHEPGYSIENHKADPIGFLFFRFESQEQMQRVMIDRYAEIQLIMR